MKYINFITTLSVHQKNEILRWFVFTLISGLSVLFFVLVTIVPQIHDLYCQKQAISAAKKKVESYVVLLENQTKLIKENDLVTKRKAKINRYERNEKNPLNCLDTIFGVCNDGIRLECITTNKKKLAIAFVCPSIEKSVDLIKNLSNLDIFSNVVLNSIQHNAQDNAFRCLVKAELIFR